ncbi:MAG: fibronectin type III domain-containing protein, partial [Chloroflexi bacterium]|nr:fibronectin type III domain-containing protein [Chloroflexota bacterium]
VTLDQLPSVDLLNLDANVGFSSRQVITAVALDGLGDPIVGKKLTLKPSVKGAIGTGCKSQLVSTTNNLGRATFYFCPVKTTEFTVDGLSIVGSAPLLIEVRTRPSEPRNLKGTVLKKAVALSWTIPAEINAGSVTDYLVQYRVQGSTPWITFREGVSTSRNVKVTGLTTSQVYEFRVAAKNKAGAGTWSTVVVASPK